VCGFTFDGVVKGKICSLCEHFWDSKTAQCRLQMTFYEAIIFYLLLT